MKIDSETIKLPLTALPLIGPGYGQRLQAFGIKTIEDLLHYYPFRYTDLTLTTNISSLQADVTVSLNGQVLTIGNTYTRSGKTIQKAVFSDGTGTIPVIWYNQPFLVKNFTRQAQVSLSGKVVDYHGHLTLQSPQYETLRSTIPIHTGRLVPVYHETTGLSSKWLRSRLYPLLQNLSPSLDWLPETIKHEGHLLPLPVALQKIHFPAGSEDIRLATERLSFDELFLHQLASQLRKRSWQTKRQSYQLVVDPPALQKFIDRLPFKLTTGQLQALRDIVSDLQQPTAMNRLLQGDVGAGKTVVAAAAIYICYLNHLPAIFMAPTEILVMQHYQTLSHLLEPLGLKIALHTHSTTVKLPQADLYLGTQALLFRSLPQTVGLIVIDEQHRFGVEQRSQLQAQATLPNVLSMTATPIPRTIALTLYAELDISAIPELPPGRLPVKTWLVPEPKRQSAYTWIRSQITESAQAFIVCPFIFDSVTPMLDEVKAAETEYERLRTKIFPDLRLGLIHGQLKADAKTKVLQTFKDKQLDILVATPVIEVGIDFPQATIMVIEGAERFGLAQLHQLRGRVGRGEVQSYCLLFTTGKNPTRRLTYMTRTYSGLDLAEFDLKLRGPGDLYGTRQSGYLDLKIARLDDQDMITRTYQTAIRLLDTDPDLKNHPRVREQLKALLAKPTSAN